MTEDCSRCGGNAMPQQYNEFWDKLVAGQLPAKIAIPVFLSMADIKPVKGWENV